MSRNKTRSRRRGRHNHYSDGEDVNPMSFVSNLSDVMLILAVGIMLALIIHWNVTIETDESQGTGSNTQEQTTQEESAISFDNDDLEEQQELPENMEKKGEVYYDSASGKYYIVEGSGDSGN